MNTKTRNFQTWVKKTRGAVPFNQRRAVKKLNKIHSLQYLRTKLDSKICICVTILGQINFSVVKMYQIGLEDVKVKRVKGEPITDELDPHSCFSNEINLPLFVLYKINIFAFFNM